MANTDKNIINLIRKQAIDTNIKMAELAKKIQQSQGAVNSISINGGVPKTGIVQYTIAASVDNNHCLTFKVQ